MKQLQQVFKLSLITLLSFILVACSNEETNDNSEKKESNDNENYPVTITNADRELEFDKSPERVIGLYQQEAELFAALDLEDKLVGYSIVSDNTPKDLEEKIKDVPVLSENGYPSKEVILENDPDFIVGSERTFTNSEVGSVEEYDKLGITAYVTESEKPETIDNMVYKQIEETSNIFGVKDRGEELIHSIQSDIDEITDTVGDVENPVKVMQMSAGESGSAQVSGGISLDNYLIGLAGGKNIFSDVDEYLLEASWEEIIERNPDVIVISYCCGTTPEDLIETIKNNPSMEEVTAVKEDNFIDIPVEDTTGNVRVVRGLRTLAEGFYPKKFK